MDNVISLKAHRTLIECRRLFKGYDDRLDKMDKTDLLTEFERYRKEAVNYPHHLLTLVKGEILLSKLGKMQITKELQVFINNELLRINKEIKLRLQST